MPTDGIVFFLYKEQNDMSVRGIRGAITIEKNEEETILEATRELLAAIQQANPSLVLDDLASALFTVTTDLTAAYPARAARDMGWSDVPLLCVQEVPVEGSLPFCIRVLLTWNTPLSQKHIHHVYLRQAAALRPDLAFDLNTEPSKQVTK
jgi:chorismate mutase